MVSVQVADIKNLFSAVTKNIFLIVVVVNIILIYY
jgi:hypothetical protein